MELAGYTHVTSIPVIMIIKEEAVNNKEVSVETQKELDKEGWK